MNEPDRQARIDELLDRDEITRLIQRLARGTDRMDRELIASCYHPGAFDDHNSFRGDGEAFADWAVDVLNHFEVTMHFIGPPRIEFDEPGGDEAYSETYCVAHHVSRPDERGDQTDMVLGLRYVDRLERRAAGAGPAVWKIAHRVCAFDWTRTVPVRGEEKFVFEEDFTIGHRDRSDVTYRIETLGR